jgi:hypothetical protein
MDLDEPLRDDEKLFVPKPYARPEPLFNDPYQPNLLKSKPDVLHNGKQVESKPKKTRRYLSIFKRSTNISNFFSKHKEKEPKPVEHEKKAKKHRKKKQLAVEEVYNSIESPSEMKGKLKRHKSATKSSEDILIPISDVGIPQNFPDASAGYHELCSNGRLTLVSKILKLSSIFLELRN